MSPKKSRLFPILFVVFMDTLGYGLVIPVLSTILYESQFIANKYSHNEISILYGILAALYPLGQFFGAPILGALSDRYGRRKMLLLSILGTTVGYLLFALGIVTLNIPLLLFGRLLDGFTGGNISIAFSAAADISKTDKEKSRNFGYMGVAYALGLILGPYFGGKLSTPGAFGFLNDETPFLLASLFDGISFIFIYYGFKETLKEPTKTELSLFTGMRHIKKAFMIPNLRTIFLTTFFLLLGFTIFVNFFPILLQEKFGFDKAGIGNFFAFAGICVVIGLAGVNNLLLKYFSARTLMLFTSLIIAICFPLILLIERVEFIYLLTPFIAISHGMNLTNGTSLTSMQTSDDTQGEILGINESVRSLAQTVPSLIGGLALAEHLELPILIGGISSFLGWLVYISFFRQNKMAEKFDD